MNRMRAVAIGIVVSSTFVYAALVMAQQKVQMPMTQSRALSELSLTETTHDSYQTGLNVVRLINKAEVDYRRENGAYATQGQLLLYGVTQIQAGLLRLNALTQFQRLQLSAGPEVVPGWNLSLVVSADRHNYELTLRRVDDKQCRFSFFSDDSGQIYEGGAISCSVEVAPDGE